MRLLTTIILLPLFAVLHAQKVDVYAGVDKTMAQIPDSSTHSAPSIARYITAHFATPADKARAAFVWVAKNTRYDVENMYAQNIYHDVNELVEKVLKTHKGVCAHYAQLFSAILTEMHMKNYVIAGYTKQNGRVANLPHSWCGALINGSWFLFDPTWGAGFVQNGKYVARFNNAYFMVKPEVLISTHMPFDPLWQFSNNPLTNAEFIEGNMVNKKKGLFFHYADSLRRYDRQSTIEQLIASTRRIEQNGVLNKMIDDMSQNNQHDIVYWKNKAAVDKFNVAVHTYNDGIALLNRFIDYRNNQFTPKKEDKEIQSMVDEAENVLLNSREQLWGIRDTDGNTANSMAQLNKSIENALGSVNEQKLFLAKYFKTGKLFRKTRFVKYSVMGVPVN